MELFNLGTRSRKIGLTIRRKISKDEYSMENVDDFFNDDEDDQENAYDDTTSGSNIFSSLNNNNTNTNNNSRQPEPNRVSSALNNNNVRNSNIKNRRHSRMSNSFIIDNLSSATDVQINYNDNTNIENAHNLDNDVIPTSGNMTITPPQSQVFLQRSTNNNQTQKHILPKNASSTLFKNYRTSNIPQNVINTPNYYTQDSNQNQLNTLNNNIPNLQPSTNISPNNNISQYQPYGDHGDGPQSDLPLDDIIPAPIDNNSPFINNEESFILPKKTTQLPLILITLAKIKKRLIYKKIWKLQILVFLKEQEELFVETNNPKRFIESSNHQLIDEIDRNKNIAEGEDEITTIEYEDHEIDEEEIRKHIDDLDKKEDGFELVSEEDEDYIDMETAGLSSSSSSDDDDYEDNQKPTHEQLEDAEKNMKMLKMLKFIKKQSSLMAATRARSNNDSSTQNLLTDSNFDIKTGLRKSKRIKIAPLDYWRNEKVVYTRKSKAPVLDIEKIITYEPTEEDFDENFQESTKRRVQNSKKRLDLKHRVENFSSDRPKGMRKRGRPPKPKNISTSTETSKDINEKLLSEIKSGSIEEAKWIKTGVLQNSSVNSQDDTDIDDKEIIAFSANSNLKEKTFKHGDEEFSLQIMSEKYKDLFASGIIKIPVGGKKNMTDSDHTFMNFHVIQGVLEVILNEKTFIVIEGSSFQIPIFNNYSFKNKGNNEVKMYFVQVSINNDILINEQTSFTNANIVSQNEDISKVSNNDDDDQFDFKIGNNHSTTIEDHSIKQVPDEQAPFIKMEQGADINVSSMEVEGGHVDGSDVNSNASILASNKIVDNILSSPNISRIKNLPINQSLTSMSMTDIGS
ncbi:hypothetical protein TBLA_0B05500 [Henningerozyma blattae CBS 6284]|uniref:Uncharacterized protein n=1 Tax=Henningerozyma blattae (strain ATCC 34711 / CBS 6284 / DSM 70876 / NBRC 10599 / NRRL Y-10934 / UCD 77-7) TaxID=1071380 RepID=I2GZ27_HENB6|nr:hypothetical protein TBLA_0B05500 [Tetrapisispora blattae CBS 6284]CCH59379.1 hypothetical protein TBLA_0B05500 [Tetrapisispora blattae CBS 6284]